MAWIFLATFAQFLNAIVAVLDKYIVSDERALPKPFVYAFYSALLTGSWLLIYLVGLVPGVAGWGVPTLANVEPLTLEVLALAFLSAYTAFFSLVSMFNALKFGDASNVMPTIGAVSAITTFALSYLLLNTTLDDNFVFGVALLATGTLLVAQSLPGREQILRVTHSGLFFGLHFVTMKGLFETTSFDDGFFWSRVALLLFALSLLLVPVYANLIGSQTGRTSARTGGLVIATKIVAGIAAFLLLKATDWGEVAVVQALDGVKFVFILVLTALFGQLLPKSAADRDTRPQTVVRRFLYVTLIAVGFVLLFA
ncbi:MAG: hypothetical protein GVY29_12505 [Spirochaetes bacterium]|jgi:uncharacterized membrane protein|nr:hypothetical protein [Spirochaetota bacterium]